MAADAITIPPADWIGAACRLHAPPSTSAWPLTLRLPSGESARVTADDWAAADWLTADGRARLVLLAAAAAAAAPSSTHWFAFLAPSVPTDSAAVDVETGATYLTAYCQLLVDAAAAAHSAADLAAVVGRHAQHLLSPHNHCTRHWTVLLFVTGILAAGPGADGADLVAFWLDAEERLARHLATSAAPPPPSSSSPLSALEDRLQGLRLGCLFTPLSAAVQQRDPRALALLHRDALAQLHAHTYAHREAAAACVPAQLRSLAETLRAALLECRQQPRVYCRRAGLAQFARPPPPPTAPGQWQPSRDHEHVRERLVALADVDLEDLVHPARAPPCLQRLLVAGGTGRLHDDERFLLGSWLSAALAAPPSRAALMALFPRTPATQQTQLGQLADKVAELARHPRALPGCPHTIKAGYCAFAAEASAAATAVSTARRQCAQACTGGAFINHPLDHWLYHFRRQ